MQLFNGLNIERMSLQTACDHLKETHPELANIILDWKPKERNYQFYKARYFYGETILKQGKLQLPLVNGGTVALNDPVVPDKIKKELSYSSFPVGVILNNTAEVFVELDTKIISLAVFEQGVPLGLLESLKNSESFCFKNVWTVTAGSRTAFMSPKISDKFLHAKIQRAFGSDNPAPRMSSEHFDVFVEIMQKSGEQKKWYVDILFFAGDWFVADKKNLHWLRFHHYLQDYLLQYTGFARYRPTFNVIWHFFSYALNQKKKRISSSIFDHLKNLILGAIGVSPLYAPASDNTRGPMEEIQRVYLDIYGLQYAPTIMVPQHVSFNKNALPAYFSLRQQNSFESNPRNKESESLITDLIQLQSLLRDFLTMVDRKKLKLEDTIIESIINATNFNFYHIDARNYKNINNTKKLPEDDKMLVKLFHSKLFLEFAYTSSFFRSCIQISRNSEIEIEQQISVID